MNLDNFITRHQEAIEAEQKLQSVMMDNLSSFDNHFYFHMNSSVSGVDLGEYDVNVGFTFYMPVVNDDKYTLKAMTIATSFVLYENSTIFSSSNFSMQLHDCDADLQTAFFMLNSQELLKIDPQIYKDFFDNIPTDNFTAQRLKTDLHTKTLQSYDALKGSFPDFLQDINKTQIQPFFDHWLISEFKGNDNVQELHIAGLQKNFNKLFDTLVCSLYAKTSTDTKILSNDPLQDILEVSQIHETIKNHHHLDQTLLSKAGHTALKKI